MMNHAVEAEWLLFAERSWKKVLQEAIDQKDAERENYARWILNDVIAPKIKRTETDKPRLF